MLMQMHTGTLFTNPITGIVAAVIPTFTPDPGFLLVQAETLEALRACIQEGMELHHYSRGIRPWTFIRLDPAPILAPIGISAAVFRKDRYDRIKEAHGFDQDYFRENANFVSCLFGETRLTFPTFDLQVPIPELLVEIYDRLKAAITSSGAESGQVERALVRIFAK